MFTEHITVYADVVCYLYISVHNVATVHMVNSGRHLEGGDQKHENVGTDWLVIVEIVHFFEFTAFSRFSKTNQQYHIEMKHSFNSPEPWEAMPVFLKVSPTKEVSRKVFLQTWNSIRHFSQKHTSTRQWVFFIFEKTQVGGKVLLRISARPACDRPLPLMVTS